MNVVTITSSKLRAKASSPRATMAVESIGMVSSRNVGRGVAPRWAEASTRDIEVRRRRAMTSLKTTTMQKVRAR